MPNQQDPVYFIYPALLVEIDQKKDQLDLAEENKSRRIIHWQETNKMAF